MGHKAKFLIPVLLLGALSLALCFLLFNQNQSLLQQQSATQLSKTSENLNWFINRQMEKEHSLFTGLIGNTSWQSIIANQQYTYALGLINSGAKSLDINLTGLYIHQQQLLQLNNQPQPSSNLQGLESFLADVENDSALLRFNGKQAFIKKYYIEISDQHYSLLSLRYLDQNFLENLERLSALDLSWQQPETSDTSLQVNTAIHLTGLKETPLYASMPVQSDSDLALISLLVIALTLCGCIVIYFQYSNEFIDAQKQIIDKIHSFGAKLPSDLDIMEWKIKPVSKMHFAEKAFISYLENIERYVNQLSLKLDKVKAEQQKLEMKKKLLAQERDLALEAPKQKAEFFSKMADEITIPLNGVNSMLNLLADSNLPADAADLVRLCKGSANNLIASVNNILDYSRLDAGRLELKRRSFAPSALVEEVVMSFADEAKQKGLSLEYNLASDVPESITGDKQRIHQILSNLAGNAVRFTKVGEVGIYVDRKNYQGKNYLRFSVKDTGVGMDKDAQKKLFSSLTSDRSLNKASFAGRLKLIVAKRLAEAMGGQIGVNSEPGQGSRFWFTVEID